MNIISLDNNITRFKSSQNISGNLALNTDSRINYDKLEENEIRLSQDELISQFKTEILNTIRNDEFEDGTVSSSEEYVREINETESQSYLKAALMQLYLDNLDNEKVLTGLLLMVSSLSYVEASPEGPIMAMGLLQNKNCAVRDRAIQAFERWNSKKSIPVLKALHCDKRWLQRYVDKVIAYLERDGID